MADREPAPPAAFTLTTVASSMVGVINPSLAETANQPFQWRSPERPSRGWKTRPRIAAVAAARFREGHLAAGCGGEAVQGRESPFHGAIQRYRHCQLLRRRVGSPMVVLLKGDKAALSLTSGWVLSRDRRRTERLFANGL